MTKGQKNVYVYTETSRGGKYTALMKFSDGSQHRAYTRFTDKKKARAAAMGMWKQKAREKGLLPGKVEVSPRKNGVNGHATKTVGSEMDRGNVVSAALFAIVEAVKELAVEDLPWVFQVATRLRERQFQRLQKTNRGEEQHAAKIS